MAAYGGHFTTTCFEHIIAFISTTAFDSSMKFGMHILYIWTGTTYMYMYIQKKIICKQGLKVKRLFFLFFDL